MMNFDKLDKTMRIFETSTDLCALPGIYMVARIDGRSFSRLTKEVCQFEAPYDERFRDMMVETVKHLMQCGFRVVFAYTQSDEISLLFHRDEDSFNRKLRKYHSILAGEASAMFTNLLGQSAAFDCRISQLPNQNLVVDYFRWRMEDAHRNCLNSHCYWMLRKQGIDANAAAKRLLGFSVSAKNDLLFQNGVNYNDLPAWQKRGIGFYWENIPKEGVNPQTGETVVTERQSIKVDFEIPWGDEFVGFLLGIIRNQVISTELQNELVYPSKPRRPAYIWRQEFSCERLELIERTRRNWEHLFHEPKGHGHFARIQLSGGKESQGGSTFDGIVDGNNVKVHLSIFTLRLWFAAEVHRKAVAHTHKRYPDFDKHHFEDGLRIGERILVFDSDTHILAWSHLGTALWKVIEDEKLTAREMCLVRPCSGNGYVQEQMSYQTSGNKIEVGHFAITLVVDKESITREFVKEVEEVITKGERWPLSDTTGSYDYYKELDDLFSEFSYPELMVLNREEAMKPLGDADKELFEACDYLDIKRIRQALDRGANPNALRNEYIDTPLLNLIDEIISNKSAILKPEQGKWYRGDKPVVQLSASDNVAMVELLIEYGAHPDLHWFEKCIPLAFAAINNAEEIVATLLKYGADSSIQTYYDSGITGWPLAWDYATDTDYYEFNLQGDKEEWQAHNRIVALFETMRPTPYYEPVFSETTIRTQEEQAVAILNEIIAGKFGWDYKQNRDVLDQVVAILEPLGLMEKHDALLNLAADYNTVALFKKCGRSGENMEKQVMARIAERKK